MVKAEPGWEEKRDGNRMTGNETAKLINSLIVKSQELLEKHPINKERRISGKDAANSIWPWGGGYRPDMENYAICTLKSRMARLYRPLT